MQMSRFVAGAGARGVTASLLVLLVSASAEGRQTPPRLSRQQRATLESVVAAVDRAALDATLLSPARWQVHVLRASDGSHYVALRAVASGPTRLDAPVVMYVRLTSRAAPGLTTVAQRSAVMEWLRGQRSDPLPMNAGRSMSVPQGEMPIGGAAAFAGDVAADSSNALRYMDRQREQAAREREAADKKRRAGLEDAAHGGLPAVHPFEDFDVAARLERDPAGAAILRSVRAGPGAFDLYVAWAEASGSGRPGAVSVISRRLELPAATTDFQLSDIVLADAVRRLEDGYPAGQQNAHPYAIGALEATPALDDAFRVDERLSVVFQVINPEARQTGKPDVEVGFRVVRLVGEREVVVGSLPPQRYTSETLPVDFDVAKGHPIFGAVQAPLGRFVRGRYRLTVTATDRVAGRQTSRNALFEVTGTPLSLLNEAPAPGQAFRREAVLAAPVVAAIARGLRPATPSEALTRLLDAAAGGRFAELVREEPVAAAERPTAQALRGLGLFALGDSPRAVAPQLQQAVAQGAPAAPVLVVLGATYALGGDDKAALTAWSQARDAGIDDASIATLLVDAYMRQGDVARATAMARAALDAQPSNLAAARGLAATRIASGQYAEALAGLDALTSPTADPDTDFLVIHALYAGVVGDTAPGSTASGRERLQAVGQRYVAAAGPHAALVTEWLAVVAARSAPMPR
jgi:cytochrome c-type biogenesis protein CcmH/NrfG